MLLLLLVFERGGLEFYFSPAQASTQAEVAAPVLCGCCNKSRLGYLLGYLLEHL
jgi:hypothetical protein